MSDVYLQVKYGRVRYGLPSAASPAGFRLFSPLTRKLLKLVPGLPAALAHNITSKTIRVPRPLLAEVLKKIGPGTPTVSYRDGSRQTFWEAVQSLPDDEPVGVALDVAPSDADDPWTGAPLCLTFCPAFGQGFQLDLPLFSVGALHSCRVETSQRQAEPPSRAYRLPAFIIAAR